MADHLNRTGLSRDRSSHKYREKQLREVVKMQNAVASIRSQEIRNLVPMVEAVLFSAGRGLTAEELAIVIEGPVEQVELAVDAYGDLEKGLEIISVAGKYVLEVRSEYAGMMNRAEGMARSENEKVLNEYLHSMALSGLRDSTIKARKEFVGRFLDEVAKPVDAVKTRDVRNFLMAEEKRGNSRDTLATKIAILKAFFKWLEKEEVVEKNPMNRIDKPKTSKGEPKPLTQEEIEQVREVIEKPLHKAMFELLYSTGARVSEAVALNKEDIDWQNKRLRIHDGKGGKPRWALLSIRAVRAIEKYLSTRSDEEEYLFRSQLRKRISTDSLQRSLKILGEKAGLKKRLTPHRLRHSLATHLLAADTPIDVVQAILGHSEISTTQIYAKTQEEAIEHHFRKVLP